MGEERKEVKKPTLFTAVLPLIFMFVVLFTGLVVYSIDIKILLIICAAFTICVCMYQGHKWKEIEDEIVAKLAKAFPAIMILICVGLMIGAWVVSGTIPFLVYIGLQIISPKYIIITSFLVTVILSVSTGTSWGAAGTVGAALISVAAGMGAPLPAVLILEIRCHHYQTVQICLQLQQRQTYISILDICFTQQFLDLS